MSIDSALRQCSPDAQQRQRVISVLARASTQALEQYYSSLPQLPEFRFIRKPECGLALVRGRIGGTGDAFNVGEMTMTRCAVENEAGVRGFGYVAGRNRRHAELAAIFDLLLQLDASTHESALITPLEQAWLAEREQTSRKAAATKVNFMTMVRGESE
ncbi:MAG: phosphonate C-P lyase system protein PhnG [unclassified Hahellaceae]|nr:phosphonate C-P lyase system protein PhnG [Hahellaceae bacterium]|tara:strand:- start:5356 stop:5829 length:474 start_codon:yes stop_codon:yes gene_type:complete